MSEDLAVYTFGGLRLLKAGEAIAEVGSRKVEALFIYLALTGRPQPREMLADLLWDERSQRRAMSNLRRTLTGLRQHFEPYVDITRNTASLVPDSGLWLDARELQAGVAALKDRYGRLSPQIAAQAEEAINLYHGDFLAGFHVRGASGFDAWLTEEREHWQQVVLDAAGILAAYYEEARMFPEGIALAKRSLQIDPFQEAAHRHLMVLLAASDQRSAALQQYEQCQQVLRDELGVDPDPKTTALYEQIKAGTTAPPQPPSPAPTPAPVEMPEFLEVESELPRPVFVAREGALADLEPFLVRALDGQGQVAFVTGEAGSGKTALLREFARRAQEAHPDLLVAAGNCNAGSGVGDAYLPFREILEMLVGDIETPWAAGVITGQGARRLWAAAPWVSQALVENGPHLIDTLVPTQSLLTRAGAGGIDHIQWLQQSGINRGRPGTAGDLEQGMLFEQYAKVLMAIAAQQPLILLLDDLQWVDLASIGLLAYLQRRLAGSRIFLLGAYRPDELALGREGNPHPLEKVLAELKRNRGDIWIDLHAIQKKEGRVFVDAFLDTEPNQLTGSFRTALHECTGGHPLFTIEMLRAMQERGDLVQDPGGRWLPGPILDWETLPARVEGVIEARINRLPAELREALTVGSVEGEKFTAEVIARVVGVETRSLVGQLSQELQRRHHLVKSQGAVRLGSQRFSRYQFSHNLIQTYLYNNLDEVEAAYLHEVIGNMLEELYGESADQIAVQLARHFELSQVPEKTRHYLQVAGEQASRNYANQEAESYFRRALELSPSELERAALLSGLGTALSQQGFSDEALQTWRQAIDLFQALGESDRVADLYAHSSNVIWHKGDQSKSWSLCQEALALLEGSPDGPGLARLLAEAGRVALFGRIEEQSKSLCQRALEMAERLGLLEVQAEARNTLALQCDDLEEKISILEEVVELTETNGLLHAASRAHGNLGWYLVNIGDLISAYQHSLRSVEISRQMGNIIGLLYFLNASAECCCWLGELHAVEDILAEIEQIGSIAPESQAQYWLRRNRTMLQIFRGEWVQAMESIRILREEVRRGGDIQHLCYKNLELAETILELNRFEGYDDCEQAETALVENLEINWLWVEPSRSLMPIVYARQGRFEEAHYWHTEIEEVLKGLEYDSFEMMRLRTEVELAYAEGRWGEAVAACESLIEICERSGHRWEWARRLIDLADALIQREEPGDQERARQHLLQSLDMFTEMGASGYVNVVEERLQALSSLEAEIGTKSDNSGNTQDGSS